MAHFQQKNFHTVTPYVYGRLDLIAFLKEVFGAEVQHRGSDPETFHGEVQIGDTLIMLGIGRSQPREFGPPSRWNAELPNPAIHPVTLYVYVEKVDDAYRRAINFGATSLSEPIATPWRDKIAGVRDSYGNSWWIATYEAAT